MVRVRRTRKLQGTYSWNEDTPSFSNISTARTNHNPAQSGTGKQDFFVTKGAPHIILDMCHNKAAIEDSFNHDVHAFAERGVRCLAVAKEEAAGWEVC